MLFYFTIWGAVVGTVGLVMAFARTGPDEARSKLAQWAELSRLKRLAQLLSKYSLDERVIRYGRWLLAILLFVGGMLFRTWLVTEPTHPADVLNNSQVMCWDGPCTAAHKKTSPEYLKDIGLGPANTGPLALNGISVVTTDRLRVFVDYSDYRSGWMPRTRAFIGEFKEPVKGAAQHLLLISFLKKENGDPNNLWWGDPSQNHPLTVPTSNLPAFIVRSRIAIIGPAGEQHYYFMVVRGADNIGQQVGVILQRDVGDWIEAWEVEQ